MRKIRLDVDELKVESFATAVVNESVRGTIRARGSSEQGGCGTEDCIVTQFCPPTGGTCQCPRTQAPQNTCQTCDYGSCDITCTCGGYPTCDAQNTCFNCPPTPGFYTCDYPCTVG